MFSESDLINLFMEKRLARDHNPLLARYRKFKTENGIKRWPKSPQIKFTETREFPLPSGRRIDLFIHNKNFRAFWIVEFKVEADVNSLEQIWRYYEEVVSMLPASDINKFYLRGLSIAAQYFKPNVLFFAERMDIQLLHLCPINREDMYCEDILQNSSPEIIRQNRK